MDSIERMNVIQHLAAKQNKTHEKETQTKSEKTRNLDQGATQISNVAFLNIFRKTIPQEKNLQLLSLTGHSVGGIELAGEIAAVHVFEHHPNLFLVRHKVGVEKRNNVGMHARLVH